jgi:hypothetical protein
VVAAVEVTRACRESRVVLPIGDALPNPCPGAGVACTPALGASQRRRAYARF